MYFKLFFKEMKEYKYKWINKFVFFFYIEGDNFLNVM